MTKSSSGNATFRALQIIRKLPSVEDILKMDTFSRFELKFEIIVEILSLLNTTDFFGSSRVGGRASVKSVEFGGKSTVVSDVGQDIFLAILRERYR